MPEDGGHSFRQAEVLIADCGQLQSLEEEAREREERRRDEGNISGGSIREKLSERPTYTTNMRRGEVASEAVEAEGGLGTAAVVVPAAANEYYCIGRDTGRDG